MGPAGGFTCTPYSVDCDRRLVNAALSGAFCRELLVPELLDPLGTTRISTFNLGDRFLQPTAASSTRFLQQFIQLR